MKNITNIAGYKFIKLTDLPFLRQQLELLAQNFNLKGTILLADEGINIMLAGIDSDVNNFLAELDQIPLFKNFEFKQSHSDFIPFRKLLVKIKKEIITFAIDDIDPENFTGKYITPQQFKKWLDENKDIFILDVRNDYEITEGKFVNSVDLNIKHFRDFPQASEKIPDEMKQKTIVMYCTGGIRCEKASAFLLQKGFEDIYQLEGGILKYFAECGDAHYEQKCFVFDDRLAIAKADDN